MSVIYTAIFGGHDSLKELKTKQGCPTFCFSERMYATSSWRVVTVKRRFRNPRRDARWIKTHPHIFFPQEDISIWSDASLEITSPLAEMAYDLLGDADICLYKHDKRDCLYEESEACALFNKDDQNIIKDQIFQYAQEGMPKNFGLCATGLIIRRSNDVIRKFNELWWGQIRKGSCRDQLSFDYCRWKTNIKVSYIDGTIYDGRFVNCHRYHPKQHEPIIDVLLVKYTPTKEDEKKYEQVCCELRKNPLLRIIEWDNNRENIGLSKARNILLKQSTAKFVCFMDTDFENFNIDWSSLATKIYGDISMTVPHDCLQATKSNDIWDEKEYIACNCMIMLRSTIQKLGGFDEQFFVAYADWDLIQRIRRNGGRILQHNNSFVKHMGSSDKNPKKKEIWDRDYKKYLSKWGSPLDRDKR